MRSFSRHCYNGFCLRIENGGHTEKRKMFLSFMWSKVEAFQIWENTVINLQPPRIMWCYKWRQLQTSFLQQEQNSIPPPWIHHCLSSSSWPNVLSNMEPGCLSPAFQGTAAQHRGFWYSHTTFFACTLTYGTVKFKGPVGLGGIPESPAMAGNHISWLQ